MVFKLLALLSLVALPVSAQVYRWVDENGRVQYGDQIPLKYNDRASVEMNTQGMATKKRDAALTPAQIKAQAEEKLQQEELAKNKAEQARKDKALLAAYSRVSDIDIALERSLNLFEQNIKTTERRRDELKTRQEKIATQIKPGVRNVALEKETNMIAEEIPALEKRIAQWQKEVAQFKAKAEVDRNRYLQLTASTVKP
jgi:Domain of unknown function (DUF4124)